ncbi:hypothetical protein NLG97_g9024 [Lecanicillium saksenae]|uniref:Uncharacterized protein n=1 Tax=Lecanicillium saksenae TaxID=468837 RepID=A0ACC1QIG7_9HYPO|nr:hypothetical protein NLG97_g9024 [Lecanicillium saksenae]
MPSVFSPSLPNAAALICAISSSVSSQPNVARLSSPLAETPKRVPTSTAPTLSCCRTQRAATLATATPRLLATPSSTSSSAWKSAQVPHERSVSRYLRCEGVSGVWP